MESDDYFLRGVNRVLTESSRLVSSSKHLNDVRLREWVAMIALRKNGSDFPAPAELVELKRILGDLRDEEHVEQLFVRERRVNPALDCWLSERYMSPRMSLEEFSAFPPKSLGGIFYRQMAGRFQVGSDIAPKYWDAPRSHHEFYRRREGQCHDLEHILLGASVDGLGELVPAWFRLTNVPRFIRSAELLSELLTYKILASLRYTVRTMIHYPHAWPYCVDAIQRGMAAGQISDALFMKKLEPVLGLPLGEARTALGLRSIVDRDTSAASAYWEGGAELPPALDVAAPIHAMGCT